VLKTKFIHDASRLVPRFKNLGLGPAAVLIIKEGVRALWKGLGPVLGKQGTNSAVRFSTFRFLQDILSKKLPSGYIAGIPMLAGGVRDYLLCKIILSSLFKNGS